MRVDAVLPARRWLVQHGALAACRERRWCGAFLAHCWPRARTPESLGSKTGTKRVQLKPASVAEMACTRAQEECGRLRRQNLLAGAINASTSRMMDAGSRWNAHPTLADQLRCVLTSCCRKLQKKNKKKQKKQKGSMLELRDTYDDEEFV